MFRKLKTIAKMINESWDGYRATIEESYTNTDRHPRGVRWRIPGKGRQGFEIKVYRESDGVIIFQHDSSETYRKNDEVEYWIGRVAVLLENNVPIPALWDLDDAIRKFREEH